MTHLNQTAAPRSAPWVTRLLALAALVVCATCLTNCNTTEGVGKDIKGLGNAIEDTAKDAKD